MYCRKLSAALKADEKAYPSLSSGKSKASAVVSLSEWQKDTQRAVCDMAAYHVDAAPDEEQEETELDGTDTVAQRATTLESDHANPTGSTENQRNDIDDDDGYQDEDDLDTAQPLRLPLARDAPAFERSGRVLVPETLETSSSHESPPDHSLESAGTIIPATQDSFDKETTQMRDGRANSCEFLYS
ncbi:hypothetical protein BDV93DRAFT_114146 [Ceratobasidium sp. AG-I]|nr:hypothetical protein BDV93DRAFT_114146 [Ceratobasidium sp. AG-I]